MFFSNIEHTFLLCIPEHNTCIERSLRSGVVRFLVDLSFDVPSRIRTLSGHHPICQLEKRLALKYLWPNVDPAMGLLAAIMHLYAVAKYISVVHQQSKGIVNDFINSLCIN